MQRVCPKCGRTYTREPSLSRKDNETLICPECGLEEGLRSVQSTLGLSDEDIQDVVKEARMIAEEKEKEDGQDTV